MKLISYHHQGKASWGAVLTDNTATEPLPDMPVVNLAARSGVPDMLSAIGKGLHETVNLEGAKADLHLGEVQLDKPILNPEKIVCVGVNYANRNEEYKDKSNEPAYPSLFIRFPDSLVAHGELLVRPPESEQLDYEGEIVIVIGKGGRRIDANSAHQHIAGLSIMNEGTIRDWLRHGKFNVTQGKNFVASGAFGPWITPAAQCPDFTNLTITTWVNDEQRQHDNTGRMAFPFATLISYISTFMLLKPGDLIATGTPTGAGARFDPPRWLKPGDQVTVSVPGVGTLKNAVSPDA